MILKRGIFTMDVSSSVASCSEESLKKTTNAVPCDLMTKGCCKSEDQYACIGDNHYRFPSNSVTWIKYNGDYPA